MSSEDDPFDELRDVDGNSEGDGDEAEAETTTATGGADPFEELEEFTEDGTDPFEELAQEEAFTQPGSEVDEDAVWEQVTGESEEADVEDVGDDVVHKEKFCQRCEHFSAPPETACTHEGTEIAELVDSNHFRVVNCPVVARRREVGDLE